VFIKNYLFVLNLCEKLSHKCDVDTYNTMTISKINFLFEIKDKIHKKSMKCIVFNLMCLYMLINKRNSGIFNE
jgi:hypothetical protein